MALFERSQGFCSLRRILAQNEKFLVLWLCVVLFLHVCQHSIHYVSRSPADDPPPGATEQPCQKACFRRRMESPFVWNHVTLISHVKELIHKQGSDHAHAPSTAHVAHAAKSSVEGYVIPKDDGLVSLQDFINQMFGPMEQGVYLVVGAGGTPGTVVTRPLEARPGWRGLLVEANPRNFARLKDSATNASLLNTCVNQFSYPNAMFCGVENKVMVNRTGVKGYAWI
nr:uncharacterized protein LOC113812004 [Penaeus vannamei]